MQASPDISRAVALAASISGLVAAVLGYLGALVSFRTDHLRLSDRVSRLESDRERDRVAQEKRDEKIQASLSMLDPRSRAQLQILADVARANGADARVGDLLTRLVAAGDIE